MDNALQTVLANIQEKAQLQVLLKKTNTMIVFVSEKEKRHLFLSLNEKHTKFTETCAYQVTITGSKECLEEILMGRVSLRKLQKMKQLEVQGNFRQILLIEAILMLSNSEGSI